MKALWQVQTLSVLEKIYKHSKTKHLAKSLQLKSGILYNINSTHLLA